MKLLDRFKKKKDILNYPWEKYYKPEDRSIEVPDISIYDYFEKSSFNRMDEIALNYFGVKMSFKELIDNIDLCSKAFRCYGVRSGDVISICMPNTPEALISFYAANKIGAIVNFIHPLSSEDEIKDTLIKTKSVFLIAINICYDKIVNILDKTDIYKTIIISAKNYMPPLLKFGYSVFQEKNINFPKSSEKYLYWNDFMSRGKSYEHNCFVQKSMNDDAVYLHSGGTTGTPKNIVLTNGNFNAIIEQAKIVFPDLGVGDKLLGILPLFHCFGLIVSICAPLSLGATIVLIPQFDAKRFDKLIRKYEPSVLTGVPTLYEALITNPYMINVDLSATKYVVCGGDSLSPERNQAVNDFLASHNCKCRVTQGYGMTETSGPASFGYKEAAKLGSVGIPLPGNVFKIFDINTYEEMAPNEIGEICISGPSVMSRYLDNKEETNNMIKVHDDGVRWVHTGDLGYMDKDGVLFFVQRLKRMLIVSGYNVYPAHIEEVLLEHPKIKDCGVIGVPHPYKVQVPKAYIVLKKGVEYDRAVSKEIKDYCNKKLAKYMIPKEFVVRDKLPKTLVGKVNYKELEKENNK